MARLTKIGLLLLTLAVFQGFGQDCSNIAKFPMFLGRGYDIIYGNPSTNTIDSGFRAPVITFDYKDGTMTEDKKFMIPDGYSLKRSPECSYNILTD